MEHLNLTLTAIDPAETLPESGNYILILTIWGDLRYGFWNAMFKKFYWMGDSAEREEVTCWYEVPKYR
jgi:hypothetical protein